MRRFMYVGLLCSMALLCLAAPSAAQPFKLSLKQDVIQLTVGTFCMDVEGNSMSSGENVQIYPCHDGENQIWDFVHVSGGYYEIKARHSGLCLDVKGASTNAGRNIQQYGCHRGDNQLWFVEHRTGGYVRLKNKRSGLCAAVVTTSGFPPKQIGILEQQSCADLDDRLWERDSTFCGNNFCGDFGENCSSCARDCGICPPDPPVCGNGLCESTETCSTCSIDCGSCAFCGNGLCESTENCLSCPGDCGSCAFCGNSVCEAGEDCDSCPMDCPAIGGDFCGII